MLPRWDQGDAVRVIRNVRNDGTYPGVNTGDLLVRRGRIGHVRNVGTFLQDQIIYSVHFLDEGRLVGCREEELIGIDEPWVESRFEVRQKVRAARALAIRGEVRVPPGSRGEILNMERSAAQRVLYHVHFDCLPGNPLQVPEAALIEWTADDG
ncbi:MAG: nitrogen fixation protein NifZ [Sulfuritalea sp.]|nr:nitrogen fixation protein NifZ [Sulfuritalea sp.]